MPDRPASRRQFLRQSVCAAVGATSIVRTIFDLRRVAAAATTPGDYKALVCVFLYGGNDGNNLLIPTSAPDHAAYAAARGPLAIFNGILPLSPLQTDGRSWGLHPSMAGVQGLFNGGRAAVLANVGPLVGPVNRDQFLAGTVALPPQLFSHSDQTTHWQTALPDQPVHSGWGGRVADLLASLNGNSRISLSISLAGTNTFQIGDLVSQYQVSTDGAIGLYGYDGGANPDPESLALRQILGRAYTNLLQIAHRDVKQRAIDNGQLLQTALQNVPPFQTLFPDTELGRQLQMIAKLIAARADLGQRRQIFFCAAGGYDTHGGQIPAQSDLLAELSAAITALHDATVELQVADSVTTFTASDFGRTWPANGGGSDHGWGNHMLIVGGAVNGQRIYGRVPVLVEEGPDDSGQGRWIPTTSVDEYSATLARWFGVAASDMPVVFPNLGRFAQPDLGFMKA